MGEASDPTLVEWLRPLIEARKATAEAAAAGPWSYSPGERGQNDIIVALPPQEFIRHGPSSFKGAVAVTGPTGNPGSKLDAEHIALNDPRDVIARCDFELSVLDEHAYDPMNGCGRCADGIRWVRSQPLVNPVDFPCKTVRLLGLAYRHFDGYKERREQRRTDCTLEELLAWERAGRLVPCSLCDDLLAHSVPHIDAMQFPPCLSCGTPTRWLDPVTVRKVDGVPVAVTFLPCGCELEIRRPPVLRH